MTSSGGPSSSSSASSSSSPLLITGSYDRSIRVWSDNTPSRSLSFNSSQVNCVTMSNEGRFLAAAGQAVIRVYEVGALQGPHVTNENTPAAVDSNFTSLHFIRKPLPQQPTSSGASTAGAAPTTGGSSSSSTDQPQTGATVTTASVDQQQHAPQVLVSTSEDGVVRLWEAKGQALSVVSSSSTVGCPILCSTVSVISSASQQHQSVLFAGTQAGILFAWNLSAMSLASMSSNSSNSGATPSSAVGGDASAASAANKKQTSSSSSSSSSSPMACQPIMKLAVNRAPISAIITNNANNLLCAATTRGVVMSFAFDSAAVLSGGALPCPPTSPTSTGSPPASPTTRLPTTSSQQQLAAAAGGGDGGGGAGGVAGGAHSGRMSESGTTNDGRGGGSSAAAAEGAIFDGDILPLSASAITTPSCIQFLAVFRAHSKYIVKCRFSPDGKLLATASADCSVKLWRVPASSSFAALLSSASSASATASPSSPSPIDQQQPTTVWEQEALKRALVAEGWDMDATIPHQRWVWDCAFSANSSTLFTGASDNSAWSWSLASRPPTKTFQYTGHQKPVTCLCLFERAAMTSPSSS